MAMPITTKKRAHAIGLALLLIGLAAVAYLNAWWPGIMLVIGIPLAVRQYLLGRHFDMMVSLFVFGGIFVTAQFDISWQILLPILFTLGAIYIIYREFIEETSTPLSEEEDEMNLEIEEDLEEHRKHKPKKKP